LRAPKAGTLQMNNNKPIFLGVNIDHVATLRQARGTTYPSPAEAAYIAAPVPTVLQCICGRIGAIFRITTSTR
jgi:hypothetical protein